MKLIPASVASWDGKTIRVNIPGYTDGADLPPKAEICYAFSDRPDRTGFRILKGDSVWIVFNDDDVNQPIVMGFRNQNTGGEKDTRRLEHLNVEFNAEDNLTENAKNHSINATNAVSISGPTITLRGNIVLEGGVSINGNLNTSGDINAGGSVTDADGDGGA